jgi:hypothetical protein
MDPTDSSSSSVPAPEAEAAPAASSSDRTKAERQAQVKPILEKLTELKLHASKFSAVKALMLQIQDYIKNGEAQQVNIVFPEFGRRIKGTLETNRHSESSIKLSENLRFSEPFP